MAKKVTLENLAGMIKKGFDENNKQHHQTFKVLNDHTKVLNDHTKRLANLEQGQEEIKLKLDQVAYRFEVQELDRRLKRVEAKLGIR